MRARPLRAHCEVTRSALLGSGFKRRLAIRDPGVPWETGRGQSLTPFFADVICVRAELRHLCSDEAATMLSDRVMIKAPSMASDCAILGERERKRDKVRIRERSMLDCSAFASASRFRRACFALAPAPAPCTSEHFNPGDGGIEEESRWQTGPDQDLLGRLVRDQSFAGLFSGLDAVGMKFLREWQWT